MKLPFPSQVLLMSDFISVSAHVAVIYIILLVLFRLRHQTKISFSIKAFWYLLLFSAILQTSYVLSYLLAMMQQDFLTKVSVLFAYWGLLFFPPFLFPLFIGDLQPPKNESFAVKVLLPLVRNSRHLFYLSILVSIALVVF